jgi:hypothetical protein
MALRFELRALCLLGKHGTLEAYFQTFFAFIYLFVYLFIFGQGLTFLPKASLRPLFSYLCLHLACLLIRGLTNFLLGPAPSKYFLLLSNSNIHQSASSFSIHSLETGLEAGIFLFFVI